MRPTDAAALLQTLSGLADVYGARAVSEKAVKVWIDVLREFPVERVTALLSGWPKANARMPVPKDVWIVLNDERTDDIERRNAAEKAQEKREVQRMFDPRVKDANLAKIRAIVDQARQRGMPTGPELAQAMLDETATGERRIGMAQVAFIVHNLGWTPAQIAEVEAQGALERAKREECDEWA